MDTNKAFYKMGDRGGLYRLLRSPDPVGQIGLMRKTGTHEKMKQWHVQ